ncbi:histidine phosphatase superfamily [Piptocephalis cylindrospora]|uniref:Histidine phosphatase superfamily n=1 Tax=Piptocephalis cylindrospora TaxID=1907219 RepID=A0A4P9Y3S8_9FUNG|nr:histidine phosphatase superfamily [Piptocephalis cylindrospora]|eukprot:RKP13596.1 histidine phosphatase superfamily [Piptocephalis cylindrospora]
MPASPIAILYLCRHGETAFNAAGVLQGAGIDPPLNERGQLQAQRLGERFHHVPLSLLVTTPLQRAKETLDQVAKYHPEVDMVVERGLGEIHWGELEGKENPDLTALFAHWEAGDFDAKTRGGESPKEVEDRVRPAMARVLEAALPSASGPPSSSIPSIVFVVHGRLLRILLSSLLEGSLSKMQSYTHHNTCVNTVEVYRQDKSKDQEGDLLAGYRFVATDLDNTTHLAGIAPPSDNPT